METEEPGVQTQRKRAAEASRATILKAATDCFLRHGFRGTSMSEIAARASVPKSLIHHHFGTKQRLWTAVKRSANASYHTRQAAVFAASERDALEMLRESMFIYGQFLNDNPRVMRLAQWSRIDDDRDVDEAMFKMLQRGVDIVRRGQAAGIIRGDVDPALSVLALVALTQHCFESAIYRNTSLAPAKRGKLVDIQAYLDTMWKILESGIRAAATAPKAVPA